MTETTETTEPTTPTPSRRRTAALWIGAACVAAMGYILGRTFLGVLLFLLPPDGVSVAFGVAMLSFAYVAGWLGAWWAVAKWMGAVGLCPSLSAWRRRGMELGIVVGVVVAMYLCAMTVEMFARTRMRSPWDARELPPEAFVDPETGEPLVAHTETINVRAGFDLPSGDAELARAAWRMADGDKAAEAPEPPDGAPEGE